jgi:hypothetical protein
VLIMGAHVPVLTYLLKHFTIILVSVCALFHFIAY